MRLNERDRTVQREMQKERHLKRETEIDRVRKREREIQTEDAIEKGERYRKR